MREAHPAASQVKKRKRGDDDESGSSSKRGRIRAACERCRERRVRCDEQQPSCGNCVADGVQCVLSPGRNGAEAERRRFAACPGCRARRTRCSAGQPLAPCSAAGTPCVPPGADLSLKLKTDGVNSPPGSPVSHSANRSAFDALSNFSPPPDFDEASLANVDPRLLAWDEIRLDKLDTNGVPADRGTGEGAGGGLCGNKSPAGRPASDASSSIPSTTAEEPPAIIPGEPSLANADPVLLACGEPEAEGTPADGGVGENEKGASRRGPLVSSNAAALCLKQRVNQRRKLAAGHGKAEVRRSRRIAERQAKAGIRCSRRRRKRR